MLKNVRQVRLVVYKASQCGDLLSNNFTNNSVVSYFLNWRKTQFTCVDLIKRALSRNEYSFAHSSFDSKFLIEIIISKFLFVFNFHFFKNSRDWLDWFKVLLAFWLRSWSKVFTLLFRNLILFFYILLNCW